MESIFKPYGDYGKGNHTVDRELFVRALRFVSDRKINWLKFKLIGENVKQNGEYRFE